MSIFLLNWKWNHYKRTLNTKDIYKVLYYVYRVFESFPIRWAIMCIGSVFPLFWRISLLMLDKRRLQFSGYLLNLTFSKELLHFSPKKKWKLQRDVINTELSMLVKAQYQNKLMFYVQLNILRQLYINNLGNKSKN